MSTDQTALDFTDPSHFGELPTPSPEIPGAGDGQTGPLPVPEEGRDEQVLDAGEGRDGQAIGVEAPPISGDVGHSKVIDAGGGLDAPASPAQSPPPPIIAAMGSIDSQLRPASEMREFVSEETVKEYAKAETTPSPLSPGIWVAMGDIDPTFRPAASVRKKASPETIKNYAEDLDNLPPVTLVYDATVEKHWVADGRHRLEAAKTLGRTEFQAVVTTGTYLDAFSSACHANDRHGLPATNADKRHRVAVALANPEMKELPQTEIAQICGVSQQLVSKIKMESEDSYTTGGISGSESESSRRKPGRRPRSGVRAPVTPPVEDVAPLPEPEDTPPNDDDDAVKAGHPEGFSGHPARQGTGPDVAPVTVVDGNGEVVRHPLVDAWADMYSIYIKDFAPAIARARGDRRSVPEIDLDTTFRMEGQVEEVRDALNWLKIDWIELMKGRRHEIGFDGLANFHEPQRTHQ
ncbi:MAG: hypothetical protein JO034_01375 [Singulisphaera sp.]|nr:hypothetical protein [Singulisphaera sp.]